MISKKTIPTAQISGRPVLNRGPYGAQHRALVTASLFFLISMAPLPLPGRDKKDVTHYGAGLIVNLPLPEPDVAEVVEDVAANTIIRGTKEYNKDEFVSGAVAAKSTSLFPAWKEGGKVYYKVRKQALDPRNFKDGGDLGTLAVRYVVQPQGEKNTVLRIDAVFVEDFRRTVHPSNGSVEASECQDIQDRLASIELVKKETADALEAKKERAAKEKLGMSVEGAGPATANAESTSAGSANTPHASTMEPSAPGAVSTSNPTQPTASSDASNPQSRSPSYDQPGESLEQRVATLRREVERLVKKPGAPLQSAPFHSATALKSLPPGAEVMILIATPYWYGVETREGEHGWIRRDQLEQLP